MATVKITDLPAITGANAASADLIPLVDVSSDVTSKITRDEFFKNIPGNVGIGTSTPTGNLSVGSVTAASGSIHLLTTKTAVQITPSNSIAGGLNINTSFVTGGQGPLTFSHSGFETMRISAAGNLSVGSTTGNRAGVDRGISVEGAATSILESNIGGSRAAFLYADAASSVLGEFRNFPLVFRTNDTERMRIDSAGDVQIGKTASTTSGDGHYLTAFGAAGHTRTDNPALALRRDGTDGDIAIFLKVGTQVGAISVTGTATSYVTSSDYRLKENVQPMQDALAKIAQLNPVTYNWKADGSDGQGFIAHELQAVVPDCVSGTKDAVDDEGNPQYQGVDTSFLVATLVKAVQEQQVTIAALEARITALEA